ncbi:MAG: hypothetical protein J6T74_10210 [Clostridia bacterium]|nr:hypothetical protein [Clostridia bacterium]
MKNKNIILGIMTTMFVFVLFILVGCSSPSSDSAITKLSSTMTMLSDTLNNIQTIESRELIIDDFMSLDKIGPEYNYLTATNKALGDYFTNITKLNNTIVSVIEVNDMVTSNKISLIAKANQIKMLCSELKKEDIKLNDNKLKALNDINTAVLSDISKIKITKNEVNNNFSNIEAIKSEYNSKTDSIIAKYNILKSSLDTRLNYYLSIDSQLDSILGIINYDLIENVSKNDIPHRYNDVIIDKTGEKNNLSEDKSTDEDSIKTSRFKPNIDTYEFAGKNNPYRRNRDNDTYYIDGGYNGYYQAPYGGYGMGYGMPFGYGYIYPNINTYRGIKNIDTYLRKKPKQNNNQDNETLQDEQYHNQDY